MSVSSVSAAGDAGNGCRVGIAAHVDELRQCRGGQNAEDDDGNEGSGKTDNKAKPDVILLPQAFWLETCEIGDAAMVINQDAKTKGGTKYADLGMQVPFILGLPVIHDPAWDTAQTAKGLMLDLSGMVGRQLPFFSLLVPFWLIWAFCGFRGMLAIWPAILVAGASFAIPQYLISNFHGPWLVDVGAAVSSMVCLTLFLKVWKPKEIWTSAAGKFEGGDATASVGGGQ